MKSVLGLDYDMVSTVDKKDVWIYSEELLEIPTEVKTLLAKDGYRFDYAEIHSRKTTGVTRALVKYVSGSGTVLAVVGRAKLMYGDIYSVYIGTQCALVNAAEKLMDAVR